MPGHKKIKAKARKLLGAKGTRAVNQLTKQGINQTRKFAKKKIMQNKNVKKISQAVPKPLKKLAKNKTRQGMKLAMI